MELRELFDREERGIIELRRWFHAHPEASLHEELTSRKIAEELEKMGIPYEKLPPNHGLVAIIEGAKKGKTIVIRADMDALPVSEETGLPFSSENKGVMHACGHDGHMAMLLGVIKTLSQYRNQFNGTVKCLFQVGEEIGRGHGEALEYLEKTGGTDGVIALHLWSNIPEGQILLIPGAVFAGVRGFVVKVRGEGGHGGRPDLVKDPIKSACDLVLKISAIPSNFYDVLDHSVVHVGKIEAGTLGNIFPSEATVTGGFRWFNPGGEGAITEKIRQIADGVGIAYGVKCELQLLGGVAPVHNNPAMIEQARSLISQVDGLRIADQTAPICASDNIGFFLEKYPGFYGVLGAGKPGTEIYPHHHCKFDLDEKALRKGMEFMCRYAMEFLK